METPNFLYSYQVYRRLLKAAVVHMADLSILSKQPPAFAVIHI